MAADSVSVDAILADAVSKLDALSKRMDALEVGEKHIIKGDDDDDGKRKKADAKGAVASDDDDDDKKDDAHVTPKSKILDDDDDDDKKAKTDASVSSDGVKKADAKKRGDDGDLEIKHKKEDSSRKDAKKADAKKADAKKADDDDDDRRDDDDDDDKKADEFPPKKKEEKDDAAKADDIGFLRKQIADQHAIISRLESLMKPKTDDEHAAFADAQAKADAIFNGFGQRAPRPLEGESLPDYRRRLATKLKSHSPVWKNVKFSQLPDSAFDIAEGQVYADASAAASNPVDLEAGELRMVTKMDPVTGLRTNVFYGKESFVKQMGRPGRRVASFRTLASS